jgi:hypothetical protein
MTIQLNWNCKCASFSITEGQNVKEGLLLDGRIDLMAEKASHGHRQGTRGITWVNCSQSWESSASKVEAWWTRYHRTAARVKEEVHEVVEAEGRPGLQPRVGRRRPQRRRRNMQVCNSFLHKFMTQLKNRYDSNWALLKESRFRQTASPYSQRNTQAVLKSLHCLGGFCLV